MLLNLMMMTIQNKFDIFIDRCPFSKLIEMIETIDSDLAFKLNAIAYHDFAKALTYAQ